ncbi:Ring finger domain-containing protein [Pleurostoma richardsiae]|uniref:Ring finger domain-containing protein n=1 Tax=Pleurostoma richardsiae TaxID=41990 RepID=A0AA38RL06_9PEZI|nr:Ring finger domain-containing protein [Pleurostoma richardsiae]
MASVPTGSWSWPDDSSMPNPDPPTPDEPGSAQQSSSSGAEQPRQRPRRHYPPRTCRICLDVVQPTFDLDETSTSFFGTKPRVRYVSEDMGRLMSPCKCKGSQKYVHEGCLEAWRRSVPLSDRNYWKCPTCQYHYRLERLRMGHFLSSKLTRAALTLAIFFLTIFVLGFIADPIINLWLDPLGTIAETVVDFTDDFEDDYIDEPEGPSTWFEHLLKGLFSLGLLGFVKAFFAMGPWQWWNFRTSGLLGGTRRRGTGRDRLESVSWFVVMLGIMTFLGTVWKLISLMSSRVLEKASDRVVDVQGDDDDLEGEAEDDTTGESKKDQ